MSLKLNLAGDKVEYICVHSDVDFNAIIGCIEDILLNEEFLEMQQNFMNKYWREFEDNEENKLIYMDIFQEYQNKIEHYIEEYIQKNIRGFEMETFIQELLIGENYLDGEIFDMLFTFTDFASFKEMFLDYKAMKEGKTVDFSTDISVTKISSSTLEID